MGVRTKAVWAVVLVGVVTYGAVVAVALASRFAEGRAVERDICDNNSGHPTPAERGELAERLRAAAGRPELSPGERARRLDAAGLAFTWAGRASDAKPLFRAEYDLVRATATPDAVIDLLNKLNNVTTPVETAAAVDELRQNHAAIRVLGAGATAGSVSALIANSSPARFAGDLERYAREFKGALTPAETRSLLDEAVTLREGALGPWRQSADDYALMGLADALSQRGDPDRAAAVYERVAGLPGEWAAAASARVYELRYPDRADPRRAAAILAWLGGRPAGEGTGAVEQELGFCHLALKQFPEAAAVFAALVNRQGAGAGADADVQAYNRVMLGLALDNAGRKAEADAVRR